MSSESESEEFFDAEDDSPLKIRATSIDAPQETLCRQNSITSIDYEEEAKQLLERKILVEERRRREEQEIEERLAEIQRRKEEEAERKRKIELERQKQEEDLRLEAEKKAKEREQRRNKLDLLRQSVADDSTPLKKLEGNTNIATDERTNQEDKQDGSHREHSQRPLEGASSDGANGIISDVKESEQKLSNFEEGSIRPCLTENIEIDTTSRATAESSMVVIPTSDCDSQNVNPMMKTDPSSPDINIDIPQTEKVNSKQIPTIEVTESQPRLDAQEPDIIKSTKNIRPLTLPPVAPPRRKKKTKSSQQEAPLSSSEPSLNLMTPTSTVESLTKDLEKSLGLPAGDAADLTRIPSMQFSLDINDVTCGDRLVKTEDVDCRAANVSQSELDKSLNDSVFDHSVNKAEGEDVSDSPSVPQALGLERPRSNSGRLLTDKEILEMVGLRNLDTGETIPLSKADLVFPAESNPLSIHIMKITKEFPREGDDRGVVSEDDTKSMVSTSSNPDDKSKKRLRLKKLFGRTVNKIKSVADEVLHADETSSDEEDLPEGQRLFRKVSRNHKGPYDFENLKQCQDLSGEHTGAVWIMKFSYCGRLLATGGQDNMLRVWVLKDSYTYFDEMRQKYSERKTGRSSPTPSQDSCISMDTVSMSDEACASEEEHLAPFISKSFCTYRGHTADVLDVSWSKNYFILTSSMDKTVRLWHISRRECLCCFQHIDFVTAIAFHPRDDRYFLSGSLDGKLRLWNIPDKKVALWNEISGPTKLITAASFCQNGKFAVVGTYDGRCIFYNTEQLKYYTVINVRSTRGKNAKGHKITGIESLPGEDKVLVTSNDSRIRLYDLRDLTLTCKYKGGSNSSSQIRGSFSCDGKYICCGSEDRLVYIWRTHHQFHKLSSARRDRNDYWVAFRVHEAVVTSAVFAPNPSLMFMSSDTMLKTTNKDNKESKNSQGQAFITADFNGSIKVFTSKFK